MQPRRTDHWHRAATRAGKPGAPRACGVDPAPTAGAVCRAGGRGDLPPTQRIRPRGHVGRGAEPRGAAINACQCWCVDCRRDAGRRPGRSWTLQYASRTIEVLRMKYVPIWVPVILILGLVGVRLYHPLPVGDVVGAPSAPIICEASSTLSAALRFVPRPRGGDPGGSSRACGVDPKGAPTSGTSSSSGDSLPVLINARGRV